MKKQGYILGFLFLTIVVMFGARMVVSNSIITSGVALGEAQEELELLKTENISLREKVFSLSSLTHISSEAARLGFEEGKTHFAVGKANPIARR